MSHSEDFQFDRILDGPPLQTSTSGGVEVFDDGSIAMTTDATFHAGPAKALVLKPEPGSPNTATPLEKLPHQQSVDTKPSFEELTGWRRTASLAGSLAVLTSVRVGKELRTARDRLAINTHNVMAKADPSSREHGFARKTTAVTAAVALGAASINPFLSSEQSAPAPVERSVPGGSEGDLNPLSVLTLEKGNSGVGGATDNQREHQAAAKRKTAEAAPPKQPAKESDAVDQAKSKDKKAPAERSVEQLETATPKFSMEAATDSFWDHMQPLLPFIEHAYNNPNLKVELQDPNGEAYYRKFDQEMLTLLALSSMTYASGGYVLADGEHYIEKPDGSIDWENGLLSMTMTDINMHLEQMGYAPAEIDKLVNQLSDTEQDIALVQITVAAGLSETNELAMRAAADVLADMNTDKQLSQAELIDLYVEIVRGYAELKYDDPAAALAVSGIFADALEIGLGQRENNAAMYAVYHTDETNKHQAEVGRKWMKQLKQVLKATDSTLRPMKAIKELRS